MMSDLLVRYVDHLRAERNLSPYTVRNYRDDVWEFLRFLKGEGIQSVGLVDRVALRRYLAWLQKKGRARASIARKMAEVRSFFRFLVREGLVERNPLLNVSSPKVEKRLPSFLTGQEALDLVKDVVDTTPQGQRDRALLEILYAAGLRVSEVVGLDLGDISLERRELRVLGKGSKERIALMGVPAARALD
ncbi:MAG: site-specific integrase, partial [Dehalococcoidia bacterium]|nr:site-specific integrase [Dehalococcoidia bacterium]